MGLRHLYRYVRQDLPALRLLKARHRAVHGHIVTMHQSGSHWLNFMLSTGICRVCGVPPVEHIADRSIVGRPQDPIVHRDIPRLVQSHEVPGPLVHAWPLPMLLRFPKYVLLLRDIRHSMVSHYEKKKHLEAFAIPFSDYLRNERIIGNPIRRDIWHRMRLLNAWDRDLSRLPMHQVVIVHYEDLTANTPRELRRIWEFLELPPQSGLFFEEVVQAATKDRMAGNEKPDAPLKIVRASRRHPFEWYSEDDRRFFSRTVQTHLHNWFGYDYRDWSVPDASQTRAA